MKNAMSVIAGIITYNPEMELLRKNIDAIKRQIRYIVIVDNASDNIQAIKKLCLQQNIELIENKTNAGVSKALNQIFYYADGKYDWVLTMDQDSLLPEGYLQVASKYAKDKSIGIITLKWAVSPEYKTKQKKPEKQSSCKYVEHCITSGAFNRVSAYKEAGGFDEFFFIDKVDTDFCIRVRQKGYKILKVEDVAMMHHLGNPMYRKFLWNTVIVFNHSAFRKYHISRNSIIYIRRYMGQEKVLWVIYQFLQMLLYILLYENDKKKKLKACMKGVHDGLTIKKSEAKKGHLEV